jgi:heme exporter protein B
MIATVRAILRKDLQLELRTFEALPAMTMFTITTFVLFRFGLDRESLDGDLASGVFWVTLLFAAVLGLNRLFVAEEEQGGFDGFLVAPVDRTAMFVAKALGLFLYLALVEVVAVTAFAILLLGPDPFPGLPGLIAVLALGNAGIAIIGTLVSGIAVRTRARDLIGPLITLPLLVPVMLGTSEATAVLWAPDGAGTLPGDWILILGIYDLLFGLIAFGVFDFLLED